jgi:hypothetical protein
MSTKSKKTEIEGFQPIPIIRDDLFCENCNNFPDFSRSNKSVDMDVELENTPTVVSDSAASASASASASTDADKEIDYGSILQKVESGTKISDDELRSIDIKDMIQHPYYKKISKKADIKKQIIEMIEDMGNSDDNTKAFIVCKTCGYTKQINGKLKIYTKKPDGVIATHDVIDIANYRNRTLCRTMPRTRNFKCANSECATHNKNTPTEAIFFRKSQETYETIYVCTTCLTVKVN